MKLTLSLLFSLVAFIAAPALAADPPPAVDGELHITTKNADYVKVQVNGEETDNTEYEKNGKVVIIKGLSLSIERNAITLIPNADSGLKPMELDVAQKDFKKSIKKRVLYMIATKAVAFEKGSAEPAPAPGEKPKQPDVAPPPPVKDDL